MAADSKTLHILAYVKEPERSGMNFARLARDFDNLEVTEASSFAEAEPCLDKAEVLITIGNHIGEDANRIYRQASQLKWAQSFGTGVDNIKDHPALNQDAIVTNVHGIHGPQLSEAAFAAMLSFARQLPKTINNQAQSRWEKFSADLLFGRRIGILGLGAIACELAPRCKAFGMQVIGISGSKREIADFDEVYSTEEITQAVADLDYLVVLTPLSERTKGIINAEVFNALPARAVLVNLARGGVVNENDLLNALQAGGIKGAAMDVFEQEPLPADSPFWTQPNVLITPHSAGFHSGYGEQAYQAIANNIQQYIEGGAAALNKV